MKHSDGYCMRIGIVTVDLNLGVQVTLRSLGDNLIFNKEAIQDFSA